MPTELTTPMTPQEISQIIIIARRAPLANMTEAEHVARLLQKLAQHFAPKVGDVPSDGGSAAESAKPSAGARGDGGDGD